ncbi:MAG TPA: alpha/beta fold hydrolase [Fimbriimonadaceae bacterium]|nr:alpha/beta fold hydrolase [Fimbriimonadaceae bacterium]
MPLSASEISILSAGANLEGELRIPSAPKGVVVFAHGSGSGRRSPRNRLIADCLHRAGFATLLFDLLTFEEDRDYETRFDIALLTERLVGAVDWLQTRHESESLLVGLFGASTGAAAALRAAAKLEGTVQAVVSRGGRPDLAMKEVPQVLAPTLFIVGERDQDVLDLNRKAQAALPDDTLSRLEIVPGATHLFEEPGALEHVAELATDWFSLHSAHFADVWDGG